MFLMALVYLPLMISNQARALAESMLRMYGPAKAFSLADRYATECTAGGDGSGHKEWAEVAATIAALTEQR